MDRAVTEPYVHPDVLRLQQLEAAAKEYDALIKQYNRQLFYVHQVKQQEAEDRKRSKPLLLTAHEYSRLVLSAVGRKHLKVTIHNGDIAILPDKANTWAYERLFEMRSKVIEVNRGQSHG